MRVIKIFFLLSVFSIPAAGQDSLKVTPLDFRPGNVSIYEISFVARDSLLPDAEIAITFTSEFGLSNVKLANSTVINGGFKVLVEANKIILQRTGAGGIVPPGKKVDIKFANVRNPKQVNADIPLKIEFKNKRETKNIKVSEYRLSFRDQSNSKVEKAR
jgi:hypothetical protein